MTAKKIYEEIESIQTSLASMKPRTHRRIELEIQLRRLRTKILQIECRKSRKAA